MSAPQPSPGHPPVRPSAPRPVPFALVGFGSGGRLFHAPLLASTPGVRLVAVVTRDPRRRAQVAAALPDVVCVDDLAAARDLGAVAAAVSTPPATHGPLALEAIGLGLHVVVDKPFALDAAQALRVAGAARAAGVLAVPYFNRRRDGDFRTVLALGAAGEIGEVHTFESRLDRMRPVKPGWPSDSGAGGGLLLDLGPHLVDQALTLLGPAESVTARLDTIRIGATAEDAFRLRLDHRAGGRAVLAASLAAPAAGPRFLVQGTTGGIRIEGFDGQEAQLKAGDSPASLGDRWGVDADREAVLLAPEAAPRAIPLQRGQWHTIYAEVAAAIAGAGAPPFSIDRAVAVARVLDAARLSAREGRPVPVAPPAVDASSAE